MFVSQVESKAAEEEEERKKWCACKVYFIYGRLLVHTKRVYVSACARFLFVVAILSHLTLLTGILF